jgi:hypothetical protein
MNEKIELFVHRDGLAPVVADANANETLLAILQRSGIELCDGVNVSVARTTRELEEEVDLLELTVAILETELATLGIGHAHHIFCHRCRHVKVGINYQHAVAEHPFRPHTRISRVLHWALGHFGLSDADARGLFLRVCDSEVPTRPAQHLGEFVHSPACKICFDLLPDPKING